MITHMKPEETEAKELDALYAEKRDKLNARKDIWSLLITIFGALSFAGTQPGPTFYVIAFYPLLSGCVARFAGHSERILNRVKRRIFQIEEASGYAGYEHENANGSASGSGTHLKALRDFVVLTDVIAIIAIIVRLVIDHVPLPLMGVVAGLEVAAVVVTYQWLHDKPAHQEPKRSRRPISLNRFIKTITDTRE